MKLIQKRFHGHRARALFSAVALAVAGCAHATADEPVSSPWLDTRAALAYWTPARMAAAAEIPDSSSGLPAEPPMTPGGDDIGYAPVPPPYRRAEATRATGILFYHDPSAHQDAHCTASVLASGSRRLIVTAAHCTVSFSGLPSLVWMQYPVFVPAYDGTRPLDDGQRAPFGLWPLTRIYVPGIAAQQPAYLLRAEYDLAVAGVADQLGRPIGDVLNAGMVPRVFAEDELGGPFPQLKVVGYPNCSEGRCAGQVRYPGDRQYACDSAGRPGLSERSIAVPNCGLGSGNSGGPVLANELGAGAPTVMAVVHSPVDQTPLLWHTFPSMEKAAEEDHAKARKSAPSDGAFDR